MTSSPLSVRPAELTDADGIAAVHIRSWRETYSGVIPNRLMDAEALEGRRRMWTSILGLEPLPGTVVIAERAGEVVGFAFAGPASHPDATKGFAPARNLHLYSLYLLAAEHGAGTGHALLKAAVGDLPAQLWVASGNDRARAFYERHGFRTDGVECIDPDIEGLVEIRMAR